MKFIDTFETEKMILMEGSICERVKNEFHIQLDPEIAAASLVYSKKGCYTLTK